jgi:hypothetical protein
MHDHDMIIMYITTISIMFYLISQGRTLTVVSVECAEYSSIVYC